MPWPGEWVRDSGSPRCEQSRGEDACFKGGEGLLLEPGGGGPSQSHQPFMSRASHNSIPPQPATRAGTSDINEKSTPKEIRDTEPLLQGTFKRKVMISWSGGQPPGSVVSPTAGIKPSLKSNRPIQSCMCQALSQAPGAAKPGRQSPSPHGDTQTATGNLGI